MDPGKGGVSGIYSDNSGVPVSFFFLCDVNVASVFFGFVGSLWWGFPFQRRNQPPAFNEIDDDKFSSKLQTIWSPHSLRKKQQVIWKWGGNHPSGRM